MVDWTRIGPRCGVVAPVLAAVTILLATTLDPSFNWLDSALSHTGELPEGASVSASLLFEKPSFFVFNGGLVLTGLVGLPFGVLLFVESRNVFERVGAVTFLLTLLTLAAVGVFYLPKDLHGPAAIAHFLALTVFFWIYGTGAALGGRVRLGLATVWLGIGHLVFWLAWAVWLQSGPIPGLAIPEIVGAIGFGGWSFYVAVQRLREEGHETVLHRALGQES